MKLFPGRVFLRHDIHPLAQVRAPLLRCICDEDCDKHCCCGDQEYFHAHRIARTLSFVLYSGLANAKQLCNGFIQQKPFTEH
jgi:hypothetical protein